MKYKQNIKIICRCILILIAAFLIVQVVDESIFADLENEPGLQTEFSITYDDVHSKGTVSIEAKSSEENIEIKSIQLPNGDIVEGMNAVYETTENEMLKVWVNYTLKVEEKVEVKEELVKEEPVNEEPVKEEVSETDKALEEVIVIEKKEPSEPKYETKISYEEKQKEFIYEITGIVGEIIITDKIENKKEEVEEDKVEDKIENNLPKNDTLQVDTRAYTPESAFTFDASTGTITGAPRYTYFPQECNVPPTIGGVVVRAIGERAFSGTPAQSLISVTLPDTVEYIGKYAFYRSGEMRTFKCPKNLKVIDEYAFYQKGIYGKGFTSFEFNEGLETIGKGAFEAAGNASSVTEFSIVLPSTLKTIGESAFRDTGLKSIVIPDNVELIGDYAFFGNDFLNNIVLGENLKTIGSFAFSETGNAKTVNFKNKIERIGKEAFSKGGIKNTPVLLPTSLKTLEDGAFLESGLTYLDLPESVTTLGTNIITGNVKINTAPVDVGILFSRITGIDLNKITSMLPNFTYDPATGVGTFLPGTDNTKAIYKYEVSNSHVKDTESTLTATFVLNYMITIHLNNGEPDLVFLLPPRTTIDTRYQDEVARVATFPPDSVFGGLFLSSDNTSFSVYYYRYIDRDFDLNVRWNSTIKVVTFNLNGASFTDPNYPGIEYSWQKGFTYDALPALTPPTPNHEFRGWWYTSQPNAIEMKDDGTVYGYGVNFQRGMNIEARWEKTRSTITFKSNTGVFEDGSTTISASYPIGTSLENVPVPNMTHPKGFRHIYKNWYKDELCTQKVFFQVEKINIPGVGIVSRQPDILDATDITVYAKWEWDYSVQDPAVLITIPTAITLENDVDNLNAVGQGDFSLIRDPENEKWWAGKSVVIRTEAAVYLRKTGSSRYDYYYVLLYREDGSLYRYNHEKLVSLTPDVKDASTIHLKTSLTGSHSAGEFQGIMNFRITLE